MNNSKIEGILVNEAVSTNALAKELLQNKEQSAPFFIQANYQSKGRGQYLKTWESKPNENLLFSLVLKPKNISIENQFAISKAVAVGILEVLQQNISNVSIKWPNDIYIGNKKVAGILIENIISGANIDHCIIGIGLNVNQTTFSEDIPNPISLKQVLSKDINIGNLRDEIIDRIFIRLNDSNYSNDVYLKNLYRKGELGQFKEKNGEVFLGVILGINPIGQLTLRVENNQKKEYHNSEIEYILPETN
jgi:BirA family biotin operon repressor/biotin-[acetyl-CoA-carboxylase] ligase